MNRQNLLQTPCDGDDKFVTPHHTVVSGDVLQAIQFDKRKGRPVFIASFSKREIQKLQGLAAV